MLWLIVALIILGPMYSVWLGLKLAFGFGEIFYYFWFEFFTVNAQGEIRISFLGKNPRLVKMFGPVFFREDSLALGWLRAGYGC